jgi:hypothetical protein
VVAALIERGVLVAGSTHAPLRLGFPARLASRWMSGCSRRRPPKCLSTQSRQTAAEFPVYTVLPVAYNRALLRGGIAQLGERLHGMQEVSGSIPLTSTTKIPGASL